MLDLMMFCKKIETFVNYYKKLIKSYNTAHNILKNEINLILPQIPRKKCRIITTLVSSFIGLAMKASLVSYITNEIKDYTKQSGLWIAKTTIQCNKLIQLEHSMLMYGVYNTETLEMLINTVHHIHNTTSSHERLFVGQQSSLTLRSLYAMH